MNDDTVPDVGMEVGSGGTKVPSRGWRKCLLPVFASAAFCAGADVETVGGIEWNYRVEGSKAIICPVSAEVPAISKTTSGRIAIPETLGGYPVAEIGDYAFYDCEGIISVEIPEGIETIGVNAFYGCGSLRTVAIPDSVTTVKRDAFGECNSILYDLTMIDGVELVDGWVVGYDAGKVPVNLTLARIRGMAQSVFANDRRLRTVAVSGGIPSVPEKAFYACGSLERVVFLGAVGEIGKSAFEGCLMLTDVSRMSGVTNIAARAFSGCRVLERISIPATVRAIGSEAFLGCIALSEVDFSGDIASIVIDGTAFDQSMVNLDEASAPAYQSELSKAVDGRLRENITSEEEYALFLAWVGRLKDATLNEVKVSPYAWLSYALDSPTLATFAPTPGDVRIVGFAALNGDNAYDMSVSVAGISLGGAARASNLAKVFVVEGSASIEESGFDTNCVNAAFGVPSNGLMKITVSPKDSSQGVFFFRVKMK